jgi:LysM repeat protein/uncharacterized protein YukE
MSFWSEIEAVFDPGGDPAAIHRAATAHRTLATQQRDNAAALDKVAANLEKSWKGLKSAQDTSASAAFQKAWKTLSTQIEAYAQNLDSTATQLDAIADQIAHAQAEANRLKEMAEASLAVGAVLTIFSFGLSDEAAAAAVAVETSEAATLMAWLGDMLDVGLTVLDGLIDAAIRVAARFLMGAALSWISEAGSKLMSGENPLNPDNYSAADFANIFLGGILTAGLGEAAYAIKPLGSFLGTHLILGAASYGAAGGALGSYISQTAIEGEPADWTKVVESALISGGTGGVLGMGQATYNAIKLPISTGDTPAITKITGISGGDVLRGSIGIPSGALSYILNYPKPPAQPGISGQPGEPFTNPAAPTPPTVIKVKQGDTLWGITGGNWKEINEIAKLNGIKNPALIDVKEIIIKPPKSG